MRGSQHILTKMSDDEYMEMLAEEVCARNEDTIAVYDEGFVPDIVSDGVPMSFTEFIGATDPLYVEVQA